MHAKCTGQGGFDQAVDTERVTARDQSLTGLKVHLENIEGAHLGNRTDPCQANGDEASQCFAPPTQKVGCVVVCACVLIDLRP